MSERLYELHSKLVQYCQKFKMSLPVALLSLKQKLLSRQKNPIPKSPQNPNNFPGTGESHVILQLQPLEVFNTGNI